MTKRAIIKFYKEDVKKFLGMHQSFRMDKVEEIKENNMDMIYFYIEADGNYYTPLTKEYEWTEGDAIREYIYDGMEFLSNAKTRIEEIAPVKIVPLNDFGSEWVAISKEEYQEYKELKRKDTSN